MKIASRLMLGATLLTALAVIGSSGVTGWWAMNHSSRAVSEALERQFLSIAAGRENALHQQFEHFSELLQSQAHNRMTQDALYRFVRPFDSYRYEVPFTDEATLREQLAQWYKEQYAPFYRRASGGTAPDWQAWLDAMRYEALLIQHYYLQTNPDGPGHFESLEDREDGTIYTQQHRLYHASFRDLAQRFGFSDLMLIDRQGERVIYSVRKGPHLGTSLKTGPFNATHLATLVQQLREAPPATSMLSGLSASPFHRGQPVFYLGLSVLHDQLSPDQPTGYLVAEIPVEELTKTVTLNGQWESLGLGDSGQAYLVTPGGQLATQPRAGFPVENPKALEPVRAALRGEQGLGEATDPNGQHQLYAWKPLRLGSDSYALIVQQSPALLGVWAFSRVLSRPLVRLAGQIDRATRERDLTLLFDDQRGDEIGDISRSLSTLFEQLRETLAEVSDAIRHAAAAAHENADTSARSRTEVRQQQSGMNALDAAIGEAGHSLESIGDELSHISQRVDEAAGFAEQGRAQVTGAARQVEQLRGQILSSDTSMGDLTKAADDIVAVVDTIKSVAEQTNLLALNAAIEAARAGEQGRGFAVVADEVRRLSASTQDATVEIQSLVDRLRDTVTFTAQGFQAEQESAQLCVQQTLEAERVLERIYETVTDARTITDGLQTRSRDEHHRAERLRQRLQDMIARVEDTDQAIARLADSAESQQRMTQRTLKLTSDIKV